MTPLWEPQYLNRAHGLRPLDDPRGVLPPPDQAWLTANRRALQRLPAASRAVLQKIRFTVADTTEMDHAVNVDGLTTLEAAQKWMGSNPDRVRAWLG